MIINMVGGSASTYAFIVVTYPSGSVCTCSNGSITFTATDTSGSWVFNIPSAGTWTVSCTDGTESATQSILISSQGQSESMILSYAVYIFREGVGSTIGNWTPVIRSATSSGCTFHQDTDCVYLSTLNTSYGNNAAYSPLIELAGYNTIYADVQISSITPHIITCGMTNQNTGTGTKSGDNYYISYLSTTSIGSTQRQTISMDVSSISSAYFNLFTDNNANNNDARITLYNLYMR